MTPRERFRAALARQAVDRTPAVFRLDLWHRARLAEGALPARFAHRSLEQIQLDLGLGVSARAGIVFRAHYRPPVQHRRWEEQDRVIDQWDTPRGSLRAVRRYHGNERRHGVQPAIVEHPIRGLEDYAIFQEIVAHRVYEPDDDAYRAYDAKIGETGLPMVILGPSPAHELMINWVGYENAFYHVHDAPERFDAAVAAAERATRPLWDIVADSPCELVMHGVNFDSSTTSPPVFRKYFLPYFQRFNRVMHQAGKRNACHADGDMSALLDLVVEAEFDVADCLACAPMTRCDFADVWRRWRHRMVIWGGIPSTLLEPPATEEQFQQHLAMLRRLTDGQPGFIAGLADQAMPTSMDERITATAAAFAG